MLKLNLKSLVGKTAYSPDLAPSDYHLFLSLSNDLRGRKFKEEKELNQYPDEFFASKSYTFYQRGIQNIPRKWQVAIDSHGAY